MNMNPRWGWLVFGLVAQLTWSNGVFAAPKIAKSRPKGTIGVIQTRADKALKGYISIGEEGWSPNGEHVVVLAQQSIRQPPTGKKLPLEKGPWQWVLDYWALATVNQKPKMVRLLAQADERLATRPNRLDVSDDGRYVVVFSRAMTQREMLHFTVWDVTEAQVMFSRHFKTRQIKTVRFENNVLLLGHGEGPELSFDLSALDKRQPTRPGI